MLSDQQLTEIVRQAACGRCRGNGFHRAPRQDVRGHRIPGEHDFVDCPACSGLGIRMSLCRQLGAIVERGTPSTMALAGKL